MPRRPFLVVPLFVVLLLSAISIKSLVISVAADRTPRSGSDQAEFVLPHGLAIQQTPEGPVLEGLVWTQWPKSPGQVCSGKTGACPSGSKVGDSCSIGDSEPVEHCGTNCTTYDCLGPNQTHCCYTCNWQPGSQCGSGCTDAFNCGHI